MVAAVPMTPTRRLRVASAAADGLRLVQAREHRLQPCAIDDAEAQVLRRRGGGLRHVHPLRVGEEQVLDQVVEPALEAAALRGRHRHARERDQVGGEDELARAARRRRLELGAAALQERAAGVEHGPVELGGIAPGADADHEVFCRTSAGSAAPLRS